MRTITILESDKYYNKTHQQKDNIAILNTKIQAQHQQRNKSDAKEVLMTEAAGDAYQSLKLGKRPQKIVALPNKKAKKKKNYQIRTKQQLKKKRKEID